MKKYKITNPNGRWSYEITTDAEEGGSSDNGIITECTSKANEWTIGKSFDHVRGMYDESIKVELVIS